MTVEALLEQVEDDPVGRLRWAVLKRFGVLPSSRAARRLSDAQVLLCAANLVLDSGGRRDSFEAERSGSFDESVFKTLAEAEK